MKLIITSFIICFLSFSLLNAQVVKEEPVEEPYKDYNERPYPATNIPPSPEVAGFMAEFEDSEVGNLKVYSDFDEQPSSDYYFAGEKISAIHNELFTAEFRELIQAGNAYATYSIKGNAREHYIIRLPTNKGPNTLWLFTVEGEVAKPLQLLAYAFCQSGSCYQQDSWITDLDGDTDLDILTKFRRTDASSQKVIEKQASVYLQNKAGDFQMAEKGAVSLEPGKYDMEGLE